MACLCGDPECPSCGVAQSTLPRRELFVIEEPAVIAPLVRCYRRLRDDDQLRESLNVARWAKHRGDMLFARIGVENARARWRELLRARVVRHVAILPPEIRRRWDRIARENERRRLAELEAQVTDLTERNEWLRYELACAEEAAEQEGRMSLVRALSAGD